MQPIIDTHCHLYWDTFDNLHDVLDTAANSGVQAMIVPGINVETSRAAIQLAEAYPSVFAAVGIHPNEVGGASLDDTLIALRELAQHDKVVAIGEIGLDYYWNKTDPDVQAVWLDAQFALADDVKLPVILHNRQSTNDMLNALAKWRDTSKKTEQIGVLHSFSGTAVDVNQAVELGFHVGLTGPITFKNGADMRAVAQATPLDRVLVETDSPFLTPHPHRGKRNEPAYVQFIVETLADIRGISTDEAALATTANAKTLFGLETV